MNVALFPGSFDPPTNGHIDLIERAVLLFDAVDVLISVNYEKKYMFTQEERLEMMQSLIKPYKNVSIHTYEGLVSEYAKKTGATVIVRGVRNANDFTYESDMSIFNNYLNNNLETIFLPAKQKNSIISSSAIKELARFGASVAEMVPPIVDEAIRKKIEKI